MNAKTTLRKAAAERRCRLADPGFAERVASYAGALALGPSTLVSGYVAFRDEADPALLMQILAARGHALALPAITAKGEALRFHRWQQDDALAPHPYGVLEPHVSAEIVFPDVLLVPLLAFDASGHRLGYGGGYYDRTLEKLRAQKKVTAIGIAYAGQEIAAVPHGPHDQRLDAVLSETGLRRFSNPA
ncbi:MAG: 5-formyltetrahydrofolate cyclo-ligase [Rhizomicrobium sp.]|nr:5-formyltetrahydrofolate cyclo-ligase [Rhizomicrobium sp.]